MTSPVYLASVVEPFTASRTLDKCHPPSGSDVARDGNELQSSSGSPTIARPSHPMPEGPTMCSGVPTSAACASARFGWSHRCDSSRGIRAIYHTKPPIDGAIQRPRHADLGRLGRRESRRCTDRSDSLAVSTRHRASPCNLMSTIVQSRKFTTGTRSRSMLGAITARRSSTRSHFRQDAIAPCVPHVPRGVRRSHHE